MSEKTVINNVDYGPLAGLIGVWNGDKGMDNSPEPDGEEKTPYFETLTIEAIGTAGNAKSQTLAVLRYHQVVSRQSDGEVFHDEIGFWMWDAATEVVMHSLTIPRGVALLAGGKAARADTQLNVAAEIGGEWGIVQSPFMLANAATKAFSQTVTVTGNTLHYTETTVLDIYGKTFDHTDANTLQRV